MGKNISIINNALRRMPPLWVVPMALFCLVAAGYCLTINQTGYYWDDWAYIWIAKQLGSEGLGRYFATNRLFWGFFYQISTSILGSAPWQYQVYAIFWRWASALALWWTLRQVWPRRADAANWASFLYAVYPGFSQQPIAILTSHFFIVLTAFFSSFGLMLSASRRRGWQHLLFTTLGILLSLVNLLTLEYFLLLDLLRPLLLWIANDHQSSQAASPALPRLVIAQKLQRVILAWLPYLMIIVGVILFRVFIFNARADNFQAQNYQMTVVQDLQQKPLEALPALVGTMAHDLWLAGAGAWGQAFQISPAAGFGPRTLALYFGIVILTAGITALALLWNNTEKHPRPSLDIKKLMVDRDSTGWALQLILLGAAAILLAGWPFWLTNLPVGLSFPNDRFTLPFMLGFSLFMAGLLAILPLRRWMQVLLLALLLGFGAGRGFQVAQIFRRDWNMQRALFWQMTWRMPSLQTGTALLVNDWTPRFSSDNSLSAPLNWIYAPQNHTQKMDFILYFPVVRLGYGLPDMKKGLPIEQNYLAANFSGSTSQMLAFYFGPDACLRVLDPDLDTLHWSITPLMRRAAEISNLQLIQPAGGDMAARPPAPVFGAEAPHGWCYYFEKADLARQQGDWQQVAALGDEAFNLDEHPNDPAERLVFIEGYAHTGQWERALDLNREASRITPLMHPILCRLWQRIDQQAPPSEAKSDGVTAARQELDCQP